VPTLMAGFKLWIPAHIVNFALVPTRQRVLYANVCRSRRGCVVLKLCSNCGHPAGLPAIDALFRQSFLWASGTGLSTPAHQTDALFPCSCACLQVISIFGTYILSRAQAGDYSAKPHTTDEHHSTAEVVFDGVMLKED
jgi:hypothetical protein